MQFFSSFAVALDSMKVREAGLVTGSFCLLFTPVQMSEGYSSLSGLRASIIDCFPAD